MRPKWVQPEDIVNSMSSSYIFITVSVAAWRRRKTRVVRPCDLAFQRMARVGFVSRDETRPFVWKCFVSRDEILLPPLRGDLGVVVVVVVVAVVGPR